MEYKMANIETFQNIPDAVRSLNGFSHIGYTPQTAIADIIDNSISAKATKVNVQIIPRIEGTTVYIADNGTGMSRERLKEAMRFGSSSDLKNSELSVYGLGFKLASLSFAPRFTVISRDESGSVNAATWDKADQAEHPWQVSITDEPARQHLDVLFAATNGKSGTVLVWENADLKQADSIKRQTLDQGKMNERIKTNIKNHLSLVFHRFLEGTAVGYQQVEIIVDNEQIEAFNPVDKSFVLADWHHPVEEFEEKIDHDGKEIAVKYSIQAFLLNPDKSQENKDVLQKSRQELNLQGIYVFRDSRLLQMPDWLSFATTRHNSLNALRFVLEIDPRLTTHVGLDVKKSNLELPVTMFESLSPIVKQFRAEAENRNVKRRREENAKRTPADVHAASSTNIYKHRNDLPLPPIERISRTDVEVTNSYGTNTLRLREFARAVKPEEVVLPVESLDDGVLYEPVFNGTDILIKLNQGHDFYQKYYLRCIGNPIAMEAMDTLLWCFARAEVQSTAEIRTQFAEMREFVSTLLRKIAEEKKFVELDDSADEDLDE
jgi:hypothetical protein